MELSEIEKHRLCFMWRDQRLKHYVCEFYKYFLKYKNLPKDENQVNILNRFASRKSIYYNKDIITALASFCQVINSICGKEVVRYTSDGTIRWI